MQNLARTSNNPAETQLSPTTAPRIVPLWNYTTGLSLAASPAYVNGTVYEGSWDGHEYALNASTGSLVWQSPFLGQLTNYGCSFVAGVTSSATVEGGVVYVGGGDPNGTWYALSQSNGSVLWTLNTSRVLAPLTGDASAIYYDWASPLIYEGYLYLGVSGFCDHPPIPAGLFKVSLTTHTVQFLNFTPPGQTGGSLWGSPSVDIATGTIYVATGNINKLATAPEPYAEAVDAINASTFNIVSHWQVPLAQRSSDGDFGTTPAVFDAPGGLHLLEATNKNGIGYVFNRTDVAAGPVWEYNLSSDATEAPAAVGGGLLYIGSHATNVTINGTTKHYFGSVRAFEPGTGAVVWQRGLTGNVLGAPAYANGILAVAGGSTLSVLDAATGVALYRFNFSAPLFDAPIVAHGRILVGCTDGRLYAFGSPALRAAAPLRVDLRADPNPTASNGTVLVEASVTGNGAPIRGASVSFASDAGGRFTPAGATTGASGQANVSFVAPSVSTSALVHLTASVLAPGSGFLPANGSANLTVERAGKALALQPSFPQGTSVPSGASLLTVVRVTDGHGTPIVGANVSLVATEGAVSPAAVTSSPSGNASFFLRAPVVNATSSDTLLFEANATGFANGSVAATVQLTAGTRPPIAVEITPATGTLYQGEAVPLVVAVRAGSAVGPAVSGAAVTLVLSDGRYSPVSIRTDAAGTAQFTYTAVVTLPPNGNATVTVLAAVLAPGRAPGAGNATFTVIRAPPSGSGSGTGSNPLAFLGPNGLWVLVGIVALLAAAVAAGFALRGRRGPRDEPPPRAGGTPTATEAPPVAEPTASVSGESSSGPPVA